MTLYDASGMIMPWFPTRYDVAMFGDVISLGQLPIPAYHWHLSAGFLHSDLNHHQISQSEFQACVRYQYKRKRTEQNKGKALRLRYDCAAYNNISLCLCDKIVLWPLGFT